MRFEGKLTQWNDDRGFGFITPDPVAPPVFVHISAFPRDGRRPQLQEALSFGIERTRDGKNKATMVVRLQQPAMDRSVSAHAPAHVPAGYGMRGPSAGSRFARASADGASARPKRGGAPIDNTPSPLWRLIGLLALAGVMWGGYRYWETRAAGAPPAPTQSGTARGLAGAGSSPAAPLFQCDGRQHCSQMTSCKEARYFLQNCPGTKMDGDGDGTPCEQDLCTHPWAE